MKKEQDGDTLHKYALPLWYHVKKKNNKKKQSRLFRVNLVCISEMSLMIVHLQDKHNFVSVQQLKQSKRFAVITHIIMN